MLQSRTPTLPGLRTLDPAAVLLRAAEGLRTGAITWGRGFFITPDCGRCAAGAVAWAADPSDPDGDPQYIPAARAALDALAVHLINTGQARCVKDPDGFMFPVGTVGTWNDESGRKVAEVIGALEAAAA